MSIFDKILRLLYFFGGVSVDSSEQISTIVVCGGGSWGMALAHALSNQLPCKIVSRRTLQLPKNAQQIPLEELRDYQHFIIAIKTGAIPLWLKSANLPKNAKILVAAKGFISYEHKTYFLSDFLQQFFNINHLCFLAGPSFAKEVTMGLPCALNIHSTNRELASLFSAIFPKFIKTYTQGDIIGAQISGAYKNSIAIAAGVCEGLGLGNNARASLIARALVEMRRFGAYFGSEDETFLGLSGAGDLFLSANSALSRNFRVGLGLAKKQPLSSILKDLGEVAEGVQATAEILNLAKEKDIYTPIVAEVHNVLNGKNPLESLTQLMN